MVDVIGIACPHCGERLRLEAALAGRTVNCPKCGKPLVVASDVPGSSPPIDSGNAKTIYCAACGLPNLENNFRCTNCGAELHRPVPAAAPSGLPDDDPLTILIPYKNAQALWAYYCGVFSLIPCLGLILGIVAIVLGVKGLAYARKYPQARGKVHAWVGVILGSLVLLAHLVVPVMIVVAQHRATH